MRIIPLDQLRPSADWLGRAKRARVLVWAIATKIADATEEELPQLYEQLRAEIAKHAGLWAELKKEMADLSSGKCWYCESRENRSDLAVDHFRPKSEVKECATHCGYWWLAFDPMNYRFACDLCNSLHANEKAGKALGKSTHFPLLDEGTRVFDPSGNLDDEWLALLDPAQAADPGLIGFLHEGTAVPRYSHAESPLFNKRASLSIDVYNLNDVRIREERQAIANEIKLQVARADKYLTQAMAEDRTALDHFKEAIRIIRSKASWEAEFSSSARAVLAGFRDKEWVASTLATM
jgi:hypothetical protein